MDVPPREKCDISTVCREWDDQKKNTRRYNWCVPEVDNDEHIWWIYMGTQTSYGFFLRAEYTMITHKTLIVGMLLRRTNLLFQYFETIVYIPAAVYKHRTRLSMLRFIYSIWTIDRYYINSGSPHKYIIIGVYSCTVAHAYPKFHQSLEPNRAPFQ